MAALASYLDAKANNGLWLLRMEDLDPPRESKQAASDILLTLEQLGLHWDESVLYQSTRHAAYDAALAQLHQGSHTYYCTCTRQSLSGTDGHYPGTCRHLKLASGAGKALRCRVYQEQSRFRDRLQGDYSQQLELAAGDFILKRKDGLHAYQLAVVVDDAWQQITHVVRGIDLLESTPRQIHLQHLLNLTTPDYAHIPVLTNEQDQKLSKQNYAAAVATTSPSKVLVQALARLQQNPDPALMQADTETVLAWAIAHWQPQLLAGISKLPEIAAAPNPAV